LLNSNGLRVLAYVLAAATCLLAWQREQQAASASRPNLWPPFWLLSAAMLLAMALARSTELIALVTDLLRDEAQASGWYNERRPLQAAVLAVVSGGWLLTVLVAIWRVPERRRRYLPHAIVVFSLICYGAVRMVSYHYLDAVLYNHPVWGVRIGSLVELTGTVLAIAAGVVAGRNLTLGLALRGAPSR
jgi:hypothetical protein